MYNDGFFMYLFIFAYFFPPCRVSKFNKLYNFYFIKYLSLQLPDITKLYEYIMINVVYSHHASLLCAEIVYSPDS